MNPQDARQARSHDLLRRQIRQHLGDNPALPEGWEAFIAAISENYSGADDEHQLLEVIQLLNTDDSGGGQSALRRASQMAEEAALAKSEFLATMSHELRTPINGILGMTELLLASALNAEQLELTNSAVRSTESLLSTVNAILDFSRVQAGEDEFGQEECDIRQHLAETIDMVARVAEGKGLELAYLVKAEVPRRLVCDPHRLRQVLLNLLGNAIKFTPEGEVTLIVEMEPRQLAGKDVLRLQVSDTGIGIPADRTERLFQPFSQVDSSSTRSYGGMGLGLASAKMLVDGMGGSIAMRSSEGDGTTFWFSLPVGACAQPAEGDAMGELLRGRRVLIIDDHATHRSFLRVSLEGHGAKVVCVSSAQEGLDQLAFPGVSWGLVCLDLQMPGLDGEGFLEWAREGQALVDVPVILMAPYGDRVRAHGLASDACTNYVIKPVAQASFRAALEDLLGTSLPVGALPIPVETLEASQGTTQETPARILVAAAGQGQLTALLAELGHGCKHACTAAEAIDDAGRQAWDLILIDASLRDVEHIQIIEAVRASDSGLGQRVPMVSLVPGANQERRKAHTLAGADEACDLVLERGVLARILSRWIRSAEESDSASVPCVLVVDDHETNRRLMAYHVGRMGYRCKHAVDGVEAVECLEQGDVDLVLLDFHMPRMNGVQVAQWIREQPGSSREIPIIGLTAGACAGDGQRLMDAGVNLVLIKPVRQSEIADAVLEFLPVIEPEDQQATSLDERRRALLGDS
ncbi:MAG: two-component system sensor histidine kinase/response regulator [Planctomycetota bacterium]|jgi:two-component system sensor histidine kinase/response regulator